VRVQQRKGLKALVLCGKGIQGSRLEMVLTDVYLRSQCLYVCRIQRRIQPTEPGVVAGEVEDVPSDETAIEHLEHISRGQRCQIRSEAEVASVRQGG